VKGALLGGPWTGPPGKVKPIETLAELAKALRTPAGLRARVLGSPLDLSRAGRTGGGSPERPGEPEDAEHWEKVERLLGGLGADPGTALDSARDSHLRSRVAPRVGAQLWRDAR
jgi:hypothetical protein